MQVVVYSHPVPLPTFDLHRVEEALRLCHHIFGGKPMTQVEINEAVNAYRHFLHDHKVAGMPEQFTVPTLMVDRVWHVHMCETEQYAADCNTYFGKMLNHASHICEGGMEEIKNSQDNAFN